LLYKKLKASIHKVEYATFHFFNGLISPVYSKKIILASLAVLLLLLYLFWPSGLITLSFKNAPLSRVIRSIEHQGHIRISTNIAPDTLVTIQMIRVPLMDALETLSVRIDGNLRTAVVVAPTTNAATMVFEDLKMGKNPDAWSVSWYPIMELASNATPYDPRFISLRLESGEKNDLQAVLQQVAQKSGLMTAVPKDWNPTPKLPKERDCASAILKQIASSSGSQMQECFLIVGRNEGQTIRDGEERPWQQNSMRRNNLEDRNPDWIAQRAESAIAQLPSESRVEAKAEFDTMKKTWDEVRAVPSDQRREKMAEIFARPEVQEKMAAREAARDTRRTPEQREQRMKNYIERKKQAKAASTQP